MYKLSFQFQLKGDWVRVLLMGKQDRIGWIVASHYNYVQHPCTPTTLYRILVSGWRVCLWESVHLCVLTSTATQCFCVLCVSIHLLNCCLVNT